MRTPTPKPPLGNVRRRNLAHLRAMVTAYTRWERALGTPGQTLSPDIPHAARAALPVAVEHSLWEKSLRRISRRPDAEAVTAALSDGRRQAASLEPADVSALTRIADELTTIRRLLEAGAAPASPPRM